MSLAFHTMIFFLKKNATHFSVLSQGTTQKEQTLGPLFYFVRGENSLGSGLAIHIATGELFNKHEFLSHFTYYLSSKRYWTQGGSVQYNLNN